MLDENQLVEITCVPGNINRYRDLGYTVKLKEKILVKAKDLPMASCAKVVVCCDKCNTEMDVRYDAYNVKRTTKDLCRKCYNEEVPSVRLLSYDQVTSYFAENGCVLLSKKYIHSSLFLRFIATCGHEAESSFKNFRSGQSRLCKDCAKENRSLTQRLSYEYVMDYFKSQGCQLLTKEYINAHQILEYICTCGRNGFTDFHHFQNGCRCRHCFVDGISGKNSATYNHDLTDDERQIQRIYPEYKHWRKAVYEEHNYTCVCCGQHGGSLNAHHIYNYKDNPELRTDVLNGVVLCHSCHSQYHKIYGKSNNTQEQLTEFIECNKEYHKTA